jgi:hypothetical protein
VALNRNRYLLQTSYKIDARNTICIRKDYKILILLFLKATMELFPSQQTKERKGSSTNSMFLWYICLHHLTYPIVCNIVPQLSTCFFVILFYCNLDLTVRYVHQQVDVTDTALLSLIENYCREAGVRNLQKQIEKIYRKVWINFRMMIIWFNLDFKKEEWLTTL